jgi:ribosomal protein S18 acetylase RimI-like enzyme
MDNRSIRFCDRSDQVDLIQLQALFNLGSFWAKDRTLTGLEIAIANSEPVITVWDGDRIIGHARATSDGVYRATIWDVIIHPDYRGGGLGRKLVQTVLAHPKLSNVERIYLMTTDQQKFYQRIGFEQNGTTTMILQNQQISNVEVLLIQAATSQS